MIAPIRIVKALDAKFLPKSNIKEVHVYSFNVILWS
jgi:hypothetical protein